MNREEHLKITKSKLKHLVHILDLFNHYARCTLLDLVPDELCKDLLSAMEKDETAIEVGQCSSEEDEHEESMELISSEDEES